MKKYSALFLLVIFAFIVISSCDDITPVSQKERVEMWIDDYNASNYGSMGEHFDNSMNDYATLIQSSAWWQNTSECIFASVYVDGFSITLNSSSGSTTRNVTIEDDGTSIAMTISFTEESEDIWVISKIVNNSGPTTILE
ncbi:hypothetical protein [Marispirochaeta aestuarii]|uniref:hypothetical protein n=1 Tax=Marispirochaeta aestuarii TaxID=1963862 RepID=UPI002ABD1951|nr:hypothetical protein [Marispirochaeta aestuarii]